MAQRAGELALHVVAVERPEELNVIVGQALFIKTVEDLHEALAGAVPQLRFGIALYEASARGSCAGPGTTPSWSSSLSATQWRSAPGTRSSRSFVTAFPSTS